MIAYPHRIVKRDAACGQLFRAGQVRHLLQETAGIFVRFHENTFLTLFQTVFSSKSSCNPAQKVVCCIPAEQGLDTSLPECRGCLHSPGGAPRRSLLFSSFTFLSFTLPARKGESGGPTCTGRRFLLGGRSSLSTKTGKNILGKLSGSLLAGRSKWEYNTTQTGIRLPPAPAGRAPVCSRRRRKDQQSKAVRVKCRINGELCCGRRRSFPAVHSLHPAAAWTLGAGRRDVPRPGCEGLPDFTALLCAVFAWGRAVFCALPAGFRMRRRL